VPVGLHLCYGDYEHHHFVEPESLGLQVGVINALTSRTDPPHCDGASRCDGGPIFEK
jgi:hypothetical protein